MAELDKIYRPAEVEAKQYQRWEDSGLFACVPESKADPYVIMMPPPNVTGSLHMGHALTFTIQDILIRWHRMGGRDALWQPGSDHAGIATQMVVERKLAAEGNNLSRAEMGREKFLEKVWEWKAESGGTITRQLRRLGASADWERERFTMDAGLSEAVRKVFVQLHKEGLIYRDKRLVNWDPKLHTAISDLEVQQVESQGKLWHFRYPVEGEEGRFIVVATTRPETMLGDSGIAVHPEDERYADLVGKHAILPLVGRRLPIVADDYADPETGTGAVKMTPAHDFNDFEVGRRHQLELINIFDRDACINENAPEAYRGLDRYAARERVVADLEAQGLVEKVEEHANVVPHGDRSNVAIEPWLTDQWYVDAATLAKPCIEAVEQGRTRFVPKQWENTYFEWMRNIQPWCISRQIWWGHQVPAWYGPDGTVFVEESEEAAQAAAKSHYGEEVALERDSDVLDTWFSSALWPFSTLGWPSKDPAVVHDLARYYPGDVLVTGFDIIFFWVARMMMMGMHFMGDVPFKDVYIHALVRDQHGQKMSKSKGNVLDPLDLIDQYGCDALRFTLAAMAVPGRDVKLDPQRIEGYRNFSTKLWNAARFCQMNGAALSDDFDPVDCKHSVNRWLVGELVEVERGLERALESYRLDEAASLLYRFIWNGFCDWYIEFAKPLLEQEDYAAETRATMAWAMNLLLRFLHPFMPFVSEELWEHFGDGTLLMGVQRPRLSESLRDPEAAAEIGWLIRLITEVRALRAEVNLPPTAKPVMLAKDADEATAERLAAHSSLTMRLGRLERIETSVEELPQDAVSFVIDETTFGLPLKEVLDIAAERARLQKEIEKLGKEIAKIDGKLGNEQFLAKAPETVIAEQHSRRDDAARAREKLEASLKRLAAL
ncbi:valine--tRNA ligase [Aquibaculum arenosum]|uniref:Valine--tRNA ligase n=1 Tax=Aquibaculum arenosum TaxID=3032591 RepID=A0ABT5YPD4_9PROT|nr:valine--tRNA ligase [Fodinicurvata sp. CAU 1616]MDF2096693.1 valine--tRNA ligase [Fodinicurvata sp. CAU 1616]